MHYQFKLEALRTYRQFEEDRLQKELSDAQRLLATAESALALSIARRDRCEQEFRMQMQNDDAAPQASMYRFFLQRLADEISSHHREVRSAKAECETRRAALMVAVQKRKTLDRLKEKGERAFFADLDSAEQKFINEMAINRFTLKNR